MEASWGGAATTLSGPPQQTSPVDEAAVCTLLVGQTAYTHHLGLDGFQIDLFHSNLCVQGHALGPPHLCCTLSEWHLRSRLVSASRTEPVAPLPHSSISVYSSGTRGKFLDRDNVLQFSRHAGVHPLLCTCAQPHPCQVPRDALQKRSTTSFTQPRCGTAWQDAQLCPKVYAPSLRLFARQLFVIEHGRNDTLHGVAKGRGVTVRDVCQLGLAKYAWFRRCCST